MKPSPEQIDNVLAHLRTIMLEATDILIVAENGMTQRDNWSTGWRESEPNGTRTIRIEINGGKQDFNGEPIR